MIEADFFQGNGADSIATAGFSEVGMTFACVNQNDGDFGSVAISLADHFGGGAELFGGSGNSGGGA